MHKQSYSIHLLSFAKQKPLFFPPCLCFEQKVYRRNKVFYSELENIHTDPLKFKCGIGSWVTRQTKTANSKKSANTCISTEAGELIKQSSCCTLRWWTVGRCYVDFVSFRKSLDNCFYLSVCSALLTSWPDQTGLLLLRVEKIQRLESFLNPTIPTPLVSKCSAITGYAEIHPAVSEK